MKSVTLSEADWSKILEAAQIYNDSGPEGDGWQSDEMMSAREALEKALADSGDSAPPPP